MIDLQVGCRVAGSGGVACSFLASLGKGREFSPVVASHRDCSLLSPLINQALPSRHAVVQEYVSMSSSYYFIFCQVYTIRAIAFP